MKTKNKKLKNWEESCKEFLKGCSCANPDCQEECKECLKAFCDHLRNLAYEEGYTEINKDCLNLIHNNSKEYKTTLSKQIGNISINYMAPEARDLLEKIMEKWEKWEKDLKELRPDYEPEIYAFAYWLVRWSALVKPM